MLQMSKAEKAQQKRDKAKDFNSGKKQEGKIAKNKGRWS